MALKINAKNALLYAVYTVALVFINKALDGVPLSIGLYFAMLMCGTNIIVTPILYILASIVHLNLISGILSLFEAGFLCLVTFIYRRTKRKIRIEAAAYIIIALAPYIAFADCGIGLEILNNTYAVKSIISAAITVFSFFCFKTVYALLYRAMRCKLREDELVCCAVVYAAFGAGLYNLTGFAVYTAFGAGMVVFCVRLARNPSALIAAIALATPAAMVTLSFEPLTAYLVATVFALIFVNAGRIAPTIATAALASLYLYFSGAFECAVALIVVYALLLLCFTVIPSIPSDRYMKELKNRLLVRQILQGTQASRTRRNTGEKLYRISEVFREIECAFNSLDEELSSNPSRERMLSDLKEKCCKNCERCKKCAKSNVYSGFEKLIESGCVKGKVSLIDLPSEVTLNCTNPTDVLARLNSLLADYRRFMTEAENARNGRVLLAEQAHGVAEVMKNCAVELCKNYGEYSELEESIKNKLSSHGVSCPELYISGDEKEISAIICGKANIKGVAEILSECMNAKYILKDKIEYDAEKKCFIFGVPPALDAAFGVAYAIKNGEKVSGDTHTVVRINEHSFLMALSDGMGSGEYAKRVSATAISLIEAFYRAEMPEGTVLKTINKLLSFNRDERFTCIDIAAVNLNSGIAEFVKIGSPAGVIMREGEIKILESQSLPMGILDNLRPTVCTEQLRGGDMVVFMSDGVTSAFSSAIDMYEYMRDLKPLNPQNLADKILAKARSLTGGSVTDDMTVLCTRIFEK